MNSSTTPSNTTGPAGAGTQIISASPDAPTMVIVMMNQNPVDPFLEPKLHVLNWALTIAAGAVVAMRICSKRRRRHRLGADDNTAVISWTLLLALSVAVSLQVRAGAGRAHVAELAGAGALRGFLLTTAVGSTLAIAVASLAKTGFAVTLLKLCPSTGRWVRAVVWGCIVLVNVAAGLAGTLVWVRCTPVRKNFDDVPYGYCLDEGVEVAIQAVNAAVSGTVDILLSLLGLYMVHRKTTRQGYWIGALACAFLGVFAGVSGFAKAAIMHIIAGDDISFNIVPLIVWGVIEPSVILMAASLPELRGFVWKYPKPVRYRYNEFNFQSNGKVEHDAEYEFALKQYQRAGGKTLTSRHSSISMPASVYETHGKEAEQKWWV